jgi:sulfur relay (sulfurtransferase) DsrC/TusE family protein
MNSILDNILHINLTNNFNSTFETEQRASSKGMMLTEEHWNAINFVKDVYH